jgi:hypothetical protein
MLGSVLGLEHQAPGWRAQQGNDSHVIPRRLRSQRERAPGSCLFWDTFLGVL